MARVEALSMSGATAIPAEYVRPQEERQGLGDAYDEAAASWSAAGSPRIPVVDVAAFDAADPASPASRAVVDAVRAAAEEWGVMHVAGHGIPEDLIDALRGAGTGFFRMPIEDKEAYANDPAAGRLEGYGSRLAGSAGEDGKREWEDYLFHMLHPDARADHARWPAHPPEYVPVTKAFGEHVSALSSRLLAILSLGLGVPADTLERRLRLTSAQVEDDLLLKLKINYYPRCPQPELAVGVEAHTDVSALSFILTNGVPGLQVLRPGHDNWVTARDEPGTLVVHVGDALEILSNGHYTSVLHRGLVNRQAVRVSWVVFAEPPPDSVLLRPLPELLVDGAETPRFEPRTFRQHLERKVLKKTNDQQEDEEVKKLPVAAQEEEKEDATKTPVTAKEEEKEEAMKPPVAGEEEHNKDLKKKEQSEEEETKMAPVAANLVQVN
ncbi:leucoanthocyanidin dioxygenase 2-like [Triticum dicoccoides]|uniref:leucoanthocyanidin dioxygenase 2-like n=1 Tax=Triticum dicoccoides TaxID=85692 RepID=UPI000E7CB201|nr:leucoanthocyanidin dioxygenase 2-like [Triticum dicoccoides]